MLPDIDSLALFVRIAELGSITKAAESSHIALAAASRRISLLEHELGTQLLVRTARGAELTPAGRAVLYHARQIFMQVEHMRAEIGAYSKGRKGHVRIHGNPSAISQYLADDLAAFAAAEPDVAIALEEHASGAIVQAVREGTTDVGVVMEGTPMEGLEKFDYGVDKLVAVVPHSHPLRGKRASFSAMLDFDFVGLESETTVSRLLVDQAAVLGRPLRLRVQVKSFAALTKMIEAGLGIGVLPEGAARPYAVAMKLRLLPLDDAWATRQVYVCVREYQALPVTARKLVDHLIRHRRQAQ